MGTTIETLASWANLDMAFTWEWWLTGIFFAGCLVAEIVRRSLGRYRNKKQLRLRRKQKADCQRIEG